MTFRSPDFWCQCCWWCLEISMVHHGLSLPSVSWTAPWTSLMALIRIPQPQGQPRCLELEKLVSSSNLPAQTLFHLSLEGNRHLQSSLQPVLEYVCRPNDSLGNLLWVAARMNTMDSKKIPSLPCYLHDRKDDSLSKGRIVNLYNLPWGNLEINSSILIN